MTNDKPQVSQSEQARINAQSMVQNVENRISGNAPLTSGMHSMASANLSANNQDEQGLAIKRASMLGLNNRVVAPLVTEMEREYTVQHSLVIVPDGRTFSAGQQLSAEDLQGAIGSDALKKAAVERYVGNGSVVKTSDLKAHIESAVKAHTDAQKAVAPAGAASDDQVRLAVPPASAVVTPQMVKAAQATRTPEQDAALKAEGEKRDAEATLAREAQVEREAQMKARAGLPRI